MPGLAQAALVDAFDLSRRPLKASPDERVLEREKADASAPPVAYLAIRLDVGAHRRRVRVEACLARGLGLGSGAADHVGSFEAGGQDRFISKLTKEPFSDPGPRICAHDAQIGTRPEDEPAVLLTHGLHLRFERLELGLIDTGGPLDHRPLDSFT